MAKTVTVELENREVQRLNALALQYGLSLPELSREVLRRVGSAVGTETISEYEQPARVRASLKRALADWKRGKVKTRL